MNWQIKRLIDQAIKTDFGNKKTFTTEEVQRMVEYIVANKYSRKEQHRGKSKFQGFIMYLFNRCLRNYDAMLLLSGPKGTGKSNAGIMIAKEWLNIRGRQWDPKKYIVYTNKQLLNAIDTLEAWSPILCDESINFATAENWNKPENKELKIKLGTVRTKHFLFILALPWKIKKLDKVYFDSYIDYWVDLYDRGESAVFIKDMNQSGDPWKLKSFEKMGAFNEFTSREQIEKRLRKHPNFWQLMKIPKASEKVYNAYLEVRESNIYHKGEVMESVTKKDGITALMINAFREDLLKRSTSSVKRLKKHFLEKYKVDTPLHIINELFEDAEQLTTRIIEEGGIKELK